MAAAAQEEEPTRSGRLNATPHPCSFRTPQRRKKTRRRKGSGSTSFKTTQKNHRPSGWQLNIFPKAHDLPTQKSRAQRAQLNTILVKRYPTIPELHRIKYTPKAIIFRGVHSLFSGIGTYATYCAHSVPSSNCPESHRLRLSVRCSTLNICNNPVSNPAYLSKPLPK